MREERFINIILLFSKENIFKENNVFTVSSSGSRDAILKVDTSVHT